MTESTPSLPQPGTVYGPVRSWRYGRSLGIDPIVETSTCSFNCIYCQLGSIQRITDERRIFVATDRVRRDLAAVDWDQVDVVGISGSGEPTLALNLDEIIAAIRECTDRPIHLLTNATLLDRPEVRCQIVGLDLIACKLDAPDMATLRLINRPAAGIELERIIEGMVALRAEFHGTLSLQVMLMPANVRLIESWVPLIERIKPDMIQLNTPRRPYPTRWYLESRGDHERLAAAAAGVATRQLRVVTPEEARAAETMLRQRTGINVLSVYGEHDPT